MVGNRAGTGVDGVDLFATVALAGLVALAVMLPRRQALFAGAGLVVAWLLAYVLYEVLPGLLEGAPVPVGDAVGAAAYDRSPYIGLQLIALLVVGATGVLAAVLSRRSARRATEDAIAPAGTSAPAPEDPEPDDAIPTRRDRRLVALATALVVVPLLPDLHELLVVSTSKPLAADWDHANLLSWDFLQQQGLRPMVDFWFPYGNAWVFNDFPLGPVAMFLWQGLLLSLAAWSLARLIGPRPWRIAFCLLAIVAVGLFDVPGIVGVQSVWRYAPGLVVALAYAAVGPLGHRTFTRAHAVLLVACAVTAAMAFDVFTLALGGMLFVAVGQIALNPAVRGRRLVRAATVDLVAVIGGAAFMLATWALTGTLAANLRWYGDFRGVSAYSAAPQDVAGALTGLDIAPSHVLVFVAIPALLLVVAFAYGRLAGSRERAASMILFAAAGVSAVILAKHMVRQQSVIVLFAPLVGLGMCAVLLWNARSVRSWLAVALFAGALGSLLHVGANVQMTTYAKNVVKLPATIVGDVRQIADRGELRDAANRRFAPERFAAVAEKQFIADPLVGALSGTGDSRFAVLGDAQLLYIIFHQRPPDHTQMYSMSPKREQRAVIAALKKMAPARLVWRRDFNIDGVPYNVRVPLVFNYAIQHYVPVLKSTPTWDLLRARKPGEPPALGYWRARLGDTVGLGGIPSYSHGAEGEACEDGSDCVPYAAITRKGTKDGEQPVIDVRAGRRHFKITFTGYKGVEHYSVRLDRLWFWPFVATSAQLSTTEPGWQVRRVDVRPTDDLY